MSKDPRIPKTKEEIETNFRRAFDGLILSTRAYDKGFYGEAARIAGTIYLFCHDYGRSAVSLLTLVNHKNTKFLNTARPINPHNALTEAPLVLISVGGEPPYKPRFNVPPELRDAPAPSFAEWWAQDVLRDSKRRHFSRKNLVSSMRNTEGGGHVSSQLDEAFAELQREATTGWRFFRDDKPFVPEFGPVYASMRQIAWELELTLRRYCEDILKEAKTFSEPKVRWPDIDPGFYPVQR